MSEGNMPKVVAFILSVALVQIYLSAAKINGGVPDGGEVNESSSYAEDWKTDYEIWDNSSLIDKEQDLWENDLLSNITSWKMSNEDEILYEIYNRHPEEVEEIDEDGVELSDDWLVLDLDEEEQSNENERLTVNDVETSTNHAEVEDSIPDEEQSLEVLDCEDETSKPMKRKKKISNRKPKDEEFYFKHKKYGKKSNKGKPSLKKKSNWKKNCCIRGKKVGNMRRTFLAQDLFQECQERTRSLSSRMSRPCRWIFWSCCEARALRRYYIHHKPGKINNC